MGDGRRVPRVSLRQMRFVVLGAGAIGGIVGARLHQSGQRVVLIARGAHREAIARDGLRLRTPSEELVLDVPVVASAAEARLAADDIVLLCTKSQDSYAALRSIRDALPVGDGRGPRPSPAVVCLQNGIENERVALRMLPRVYGAVVMVPAEHLEPGVVVGYGSKLTGRIDVGCYPSGVDELAAELSAAFAAASFESEPRANIMVHKQAKLVTNLINAIEAICGKVDRDDYRELIDRTLQEGRAVLAAAGLEFEIDDVWDLNARWERIGVGEVDGHAHRGGSTWQSVHRGAEGLETDYLTGEVLLIARQHGQPAPINELLADLAARTLVEHREPGWITPGELLAMVAEAAGSATAR